MNSKKSGLTLMEVLIALFIFSFSALYISRTTNHLLKRQKKVEKEIKSRRSHSNIMEILRQDLKGVFIHFDMNFHLNRWAYSELSELEKATGERKPLPFEGRNFMNPRFDFFGQETHLTFTSLIPFAGEKESTQLVKIKYFFKQCKNRETDQTASCLIRGVSRHWKDRQDSEYQKNKVLIRGLKEASFSYYHQEKKEWEKSWDFLSLWKQGVLRPTQHTILLPFFIQINMEWG
ncbi:MAG: prepilin-type N-terminal cleavage/methylation domain-containing protein, partial [Bdellovibrionales bacterium]|nr:prepilin-type N-terminal cleavage/methylation domain-containing protein [Bdellovibrionales bacterium]